RICLACLQKDPARRPTAADLAGRLDQFLARRIELVSTTALPGVQDPVSRRRRALLLMGWPAWRSRAGWAASACGRRSGAGRRPSWTSERAGLRLPPLGRWQGHGDAPVSVERRRAEGGERRRGAAGRRPARRTPAQPTPPGRAEQTR